jgi:hypothetical protein
MFHSARRDRYVAGIMFALLACSATALNFPSRARAQSQTYSISGRVDSNGLGTGTPTPGVTVTLSNTSTGAAVSSQTTGADGQYSFTGVPAEGSYVVTPSKPAFLFQPVSRDYGNLGQNWGSQHFRSVASATVQFSGADYAVTEAGHFVQIGVTRSTASGTASVSYSTSDGTVQSKSDYSPAAGTLGFAEGETSKFFTVLLTDDAFVEGDETILLSLSQPTGVALGTPANATLTIHSDDVAGLPNPIEGTQFFVRQHYHDFLNREPDAAGLQFWSDDLDRCGSDAGCRDAKRVNVSAAFFLSIEFQETGYLVYRTYKAAYGDATSTDVPGTVPVVRLQDLLPDSQRIGQGVQVGIGDWQAQLEANKQAYMLEFIQRPRFLATFPVSFAPAQYVDKLVQNAGLIISQEERDALVAQLGSTPGAAAGRASVLRQTAEHQQLRQSELSRAFVLMQYFGYLRRNPDDAPEPSLNYAGWKFWLNKLNQFGGDFVAAEMVRAYLLSGEYRQRFGQ